VLIQNRVALDRPSKSLLIGVESANQQRRVMVDEVIGKQEVVIKSPSQPVGFKKPPIPNLGLRFF